MMRIRPTALVWKIIPLLLILALPCQAAQFAAELSITSPQAKFAYDLKVKDNLMRLEKTSGPMMGPAVPFIYDRNTEVTWAIMDQTRQYVEQPDPKKTIMTNPVVGWEFMRKDMTPTETGTETVEGYVCDVVEYRDAGRDFVNYRVWTAQDLGFAIKTVAYATNGEMTMALTNITEAPQDDTLFAIPEGYAKVEPKGSAKQSKKAVKEEPAAEEATTEKTATEEPVTNEPATKETATGETVTAEAVTEEEEAPAASGNIVFILDASGSMWGQVEGTAKIAIAKEVLTGLVKELPDDAVVGLVAYGHRRKGDCNDVEELVPLGPLDKAAMIDNIQALSPKGKTPISRSVRMTAERIKHLENATTIILVSDGKETCDPDPCGLVKDLKAAGIKFIMHVIGFDVTEEEREQLECMANAGGGKYYTAGNAGEFLAAAKEVVEKSTPPYGILKMSATKNGKPFFTGVNMTNKETGETWLPASTSADTGEVEIKLAPGTYEAELRDSTVDGGKTPSMRFDDIVIVAGETVEREADFSDGTLDLTSLINGKPGSVNVFFYRAGESKHFINLMSNQGTGKLTRQLLPGSYRIKVHAHTLEGSPVVFEEELEVAPGTTTERTIEFSAGELIIVSTFDGKPAATPIKVLDESGKVVVDRWTDFPRQGTRKCLMQVGVYTVRVFNNGGAVPLLEFKQVTVGEGTSQTITAAF